MISVEEALQRISQYAKPRAARTIRAADSLGQVLAADIQSDIDSPPHDKALMDGYAVVASDVVAGVELLVLEEVTAGDTPTKPVTSATATRIMTGAPIPDGADAVVMIERTELVGGDKATVRINADNADSGQNIMPRGESVRCGDVVLRAGRMIRPIEMGVLAECGATEISAYPRPSVAILSTGNELVSPDTRPQAGQIRNSNGPMLEALVQRTGSKAVNLGVGRDERDELNRLVRRGLEEDVLVLSGGVSAGVLDLVPEVLAANSVEQVFHKVHLKPGKPVWFGVKRDSRGDRLVFGLPGNPVSSLVCFELFVRPALASLAGQNFDSIERRTARLATNHSRHSDRPTYFPARLFQRDGQLQVEPLAWKGSADLRTLADANCLALFPPSDSEFVVGDEIEVYAI
ncbi:MAG: molybdopterin molybdotransferase MoeA [Planctomycetota bacterium]|nr:molybdopterin molybdotransferase MoeA [Planctomycetota bacterium]